MDAASFRKRRKDLGLSQAQLAILLDVTPTTVARWERGESPIPTMASLSLSHLEDLGVDQLMIALRGSRPKSPFG